MTRPRLKSLIWLDYVVAQLQANLAAEFTAVEAELAAEGLAAVSLGAPAASSIDYGDRPPVSSSAKYPCLWIDRVRVLMGSGRTSTVETGVTAVGFLYFTNPGKAGGQTRTGAQLSRGALAAAEGVRAVIERDGPTATVGAVTVSRMEDMTDTLPDDGKRPYRGWLRLYEIEFTGRIIARQSRGR